MQILPFSARKARQKKMNTDKQRHAEEGRRECLEASISTISVISVMSQQNSPFVCKWICVEFCLKQPKEL